jgi:hypothetical protein
VTYLSPTRPTTIEATEGGSDAISAVAGPVPMPPVGVLESSSKLAAPNAPGSLSPDASSGVSKWIFVLQQENHGRRESTIARTVVSSCKRAILREKSLTFER